ERSRASSLVGLHQGDQRQCQLRLTAFNSEIGQQANKWLSGAFAHGFPHLPRTVASISRLILQTTRWASRVQQIRQYWVGIRQGDHSRVIGHLPISSVPTCAGDGYAAIDIDGAGEIGV